MRAALVLLLVVAFAGCITSSVGGVELTVVRHDAPWDAVVRLSNDGAREALVSASGFRMVDASGLIAQADFLDSDFPSLLRIGAGESVQGTLFFNAVNLGPGPYTLKYSYAGREAAAPLT